MILPLNFGGITADEAIERRKSELVETLLSTILNEVALYRDLPEDVVQVDVRAVVHENLNGFREVLKRRSGPPRQLIDSVTRSAYRRAEEGIPLAMVLSAYLTAAHEAWKVVTDSALPDDIDDLREITDLLIGFLRGILPAVSTAFIEELRSSSTQEQSVRSNLLGALLSGEPAQEAATLVGIELPPTYTVISLHLPVPEVDDPEPAGQVAVSVSERRAARRIRALIHELIPHDPLVSVDHRGGIVLVPRTGEAAPLVLDPLVQRLTVAGTLPILAVGTAAPSDVGEVAEQTRDLIDLVRRTDRAGTVFRLEDMLLEYQLSRPSAASPHLAALLDPLESSADLIATLKRHLANDLNRRATAEQLMVHPNTVDYRMARIRSLTGLDPTAVSQSATLRAALVAREATSGR